MIWLRLRFGVTPEYRLATRTNGATTLTTHLGAHGCVQLLPKEKQMSGKVNGTFTFHQESNGDHRWTKFHGSEVIANSSEGYNNKTDCENNAKRFGYLGHWWGADDNWYFQTDSEGKHRWTRKATNGVTVGASHMGWYTEAMRDLNASMNGWG